MRTEKLLEFRKPRGTRDMTKNKELTREQVKWTGIYREKLLNEVEILTRRFRWGEWSDCSWEWQDLWTEGKVERHLLDGENKTRNEIKKDRTWQLNYQISTYRAINYCSCSSLGQPEVGRAMCVVCWDDKKGTGLSQRKNSEKIWTTRIDYMWPR